MNLKSILASKWKPALALILSLAATYCFFFEYLPPNKRVHFFGDIEGYHYPLYYHATRALRQGQLPEWDPFIYCGMSFIANPQAAVFYPPNWLVYYVNLKRGNWLRDGVRFVWIEILVVFHFWIAFASCWLWLRSRFRSELAAVLGGAVFAFGGYPLNETQHVGMLCGYAWLPLGLWGIDESIARRDWRPLWKTTIASALCLLAGYPTTWIVFCIVAGTYALARAGFRIALQTTAAILWSLLIAMVQVAPAFEASQLKWRETIYGGGIPGGWFFYLQYLLPNYYDQSRKLLQPGPSAESYLYLGAVSIVGILCAIAFRRWRDVSVALSIVAAALFFISDPLKIIELSTRISPVLNEALRQWNFTSALTVAAAYLTACGIAAFQERTSVSAGNRFLYRITLAAAAAWIDRQWLAWIADGSAFATGWWSAAEVGLTAFLLIVLLRFHKRAPAVAALLVLVFVDLKVYGTNRRFNSTPGSVEMALRTDRRTGGPDFQGVDPAVYREMLRHPEYRVAFDDLTPATDLRYYRLSSPQGFDPFLTSAYREAVERFTPFATNRTFNIDRNNTAMLEEFGVRYIICSPASNGREVLKSDARFRRLGPEGSYFHVFEYLNAKPAFRFEAGSADAGDWRPEQRLLRVHSDAGGDFVLIEQFFPGWKAFIDGQPVEIARARGAFQMIHVPAGDHWVSFRYRSMSLRIGAGISVLALIGTLFLFLKSNPRDTASAGCI